MFGIGMPELIVILVVALVVLGPQRLPDVARQVGKALAELRRQTSDVMDEFQAQADEDAARARAASTPPRAAPADTVTHGASDATAATPEPDPKRV